MDKQTKGDDNSVFRDGVQVIDAPIPAEEQTLFERIDELTWSDCATCRVWRAAILIGFTTALLIDIGLRVWK